MNTANAGSDVFDLILTGGTLLDPGAGGRRNVNLAFHEGRIARIAEASDAASQLWRATEKVDISGSFASPGWTDLHAHVFRSGIPRALEPDTAGIRAGVTTLVDAGTSGWANFPGFRDLDIRNARTRVLAFLHLSSIGMVTASSGVAELYVIDFAQVDEAIECIEASKDTVVGLKIRMLNTVRADPVELLRRGRIIAEATGRPLMVHIAESPLPLSQVFAELREGDIATHIFDGLGETIIDGDGKPAAWVVDARDRGVLFDIGHAGMHFDERVARSAAEAGLWPDTLSTDCHIPPEGRVVPNLAGVMSTMLAIGMPLDKVLEAVTRSPLQAIGLTPVNGELSIGDVGDVTIFDIEPRTDIYSCEKMTSAPGGESIVVRYTVREGVLYHPLGPGEAPQLRSATGP